MGTSPTWSRSNPIHLILNEYLAGTGQFRQSDLDLNLPYEEYGRFKLANLSYWDNSAEPEIFQTTIRGVASDINKMYRKRYARYTAYNGQTTELTARKSLISALSNAEWYVYQLAELCDKFYIYKTPMSGGGNG